MRTENNDAMTVNLFDLQKCSTDDGPGLRTTVFFKGCPLRCRWCHNPESQSAAPQMLFHAQRCTGCGKCRTICPGGKHCTLCGKCTVYCPSHAREIAGELHTVEEIFAEIEADRIFYETSGGGVTFSGGECLLQPAPLLTLLKKSKESGIRTAVDTCGYAPFGTFEAIWPYTDLFLYDFKCYTETLHRLGTGVSNRLILDNLKRLADRDASRILVRVPIIPGFNTDEKELILMAAFLKDLGLKHPELLPYHRMGEQKYCALGLPATCYTVPTEESMATYRQYFDI